MAQVNINKFVQDEEHEEDDAVYIPGSKFATPRLPGLEELKLLQLWKVLLEMYDLEAEIAASHGVSLFDIMDEKLVEKHCPTLMLASALRKKAHLMSSSNSSTAADNQSELTASSSNSVSQDSASRSNIDPPDTGQNKLSFYKRSYWIATRDFHPDEILLRYLIQQDWDVGKAFTRLTLTGIFQWKVKLESLMQSGEEGASAMLNDPINKKQHELAFGFMRLCKAGGTLIRGHDWEGRPVVITRMRFSRGDLDSIESVKWFTLWQVESCRLTMGPKVTNVVSIWDFSEMTRENIHVQAGMFLVNVFQKHFPGAFALIILHNCPKLFEKTWNMLKPLLEPQNVKKIKFTRSIVDLEQYVPRKNILQDMGGDDRCQFDYIPPSPGENSQMEDVALRETVWKEFEGLWDIFNRYTLKMIQMASKGLDYTDVKRQRNAHAEFMRASYWKLDPFIRAKSHYDRNGQIGFRRESAFMSLRLTHGIKAEDYSLQLDEIASKGTAIASTPFPID